MPLRPELAKLPPLEQAKRLLPLGDGLAREIMAGNPQSHAASAVDLIRRWSDGDPVPGRAFSQVIYSDDEQGLLRKLHDTSQPLIANRLNALTSITMYVAWLAYKTSSEEMPSDVNEVDEDTLDLIDEQLKGAG